MDTTLMYLVLLVSFIVTACVYEMFFNGRWKDQAGRKREANPGRSLFRYK